MGPATQRQRRCRSLSRTLGVSFTPATGGPVDLDAWGQCGRMPVYATFDSPPFGQESRPAHFDHLGDGYIGKPDAETITGSGFSCLHSRGFTRGCPAVYSSLSSRCRVVV